jgi:hypothetical protein
MKLLLAVFAGVVVVNVAMGCDAMKAREPKQAGDPVVQTPKYGDTKLEHLGSAEDGGSTK